LVRSQPDSNRRSLKTHLAAEGRLDALDRYYSDEILEKRNGIVSRASALDRIGLEIAPNRGVQFLFEEAHRC
jgi:hypothetical protein